MTSSLADIRSAFINYFESHDHKHVRSDGLVPSSDPTLMFTNAGMVPFKNIFTGAEAPPNPPRAVSSQKCVRAGGKHNDLDNVGYTARHHTFFEMLGNFSFGDYFKEQAIYYGWDFLTHTLALPKDKLLVTVYAEDEEAYRLWQKIAGLPEDKIIRIATSDNFWSMGDTGPCGPCSEIFYDHGETISGGPPGSADEDGDRFVEIWNLVFMQFNQQADGTRDALPRPSIDTGSGLERLAAVMQGVHDNYETDLFQTLIGAIANSSGTKIGGAGHNSHKVIADHLRASAFLITDGVLPANEGRGYVLRRIMRRAMRHVQILGVNEPLMYHLFPTLKEQMVAAYPELARAEALVTETLKQEETRFQETLSRGLKLLEDEVDSLSGKILSGDVAFKLYDTYGFPVDLTQDALREKGLQLDMEGFEQAMQQQRETARAHWTGSGQTATDDVWFTIHEDIGATQFLGYEQNVCDGNVTALISNGEIADKARESEVSLCLDQTVFYGESGGQIGDCGRLYNDTVEIEITDTQKQLGDMHVLIGNITKGEVKIGDTLTQEINVPRRDAIRAHHSATHLLHEALRQTLGEHVAQKGSLVTADYLRFDFAHPKAVNAAELLAIEDKVNAQIRANGAVETRLMSQDAALEAGALALFGEKYGDEVRVLAMGDNEGADNGGDDKQDTGRAGYSVELCGGTHVNRLGDIGVFKITTEAAIASGVRRIEAQVGAAAFAHIHTREQVLEQTAQILKSSVDEVAGRVEKLLQERKQLERELAEAQKKLALAGDGGSAPADRVEEINGVKFLGRIVEDLPSKQLRGLVDQGKTQIESGVVVFIGIDGGKVGIAVGVTDDITDKFNAVDLVQLGAEKLDGKGGGGRPDMAQAGGANIEGVQAALEEIKNRL